MILEMVCRPHLPKKKKKSNFRSEMLELRYLIKFSLVQIDVVHRK